jgi:hypothetical protein
MTDTRFFARSAVAAACAALTIAAAPAFASHPSNSHDIANAQKFEMHNDGKGHVTYCASMPAGTGTILSANKVCKSVAQWKADGVTLPEAADPASDTGA